MSGNVSSGGPAATFARDLRDLADFVEQAADAGLELDELLDLDELAEPLDLARLQLGSALVAHALGIRLPLRVGDGIDERSARTVVEAARHAIEMAENPKRSVRVSIVDPAGRDVTGQVMDAALGRRGGAA